MVKATHVGAIIVGIIMFLLAVAATALSGDFINEYNNEFFGLATILIGLILIVIGIVYPWPLKSGEMENG